jgi:hypothetical protein
MLKLIGFPLRGTSCHIFCIDYLPPTQQCPLNFIAGYVQVSARNQFRVLLINTVKQDKHEKTFCNLDSYYLQPSRLRERFWFWIRDLPIKRLPNKISKPGDYFRE